MSRSPSPSRGEDGAAEDPDLFSTDPSKFLRATGYTRSLIKQVREDKTKPTSLTGRTPPTPLPTKSKKEEKDIEDILPPLPKSIEPFYMAPSPYVVNARPVATIRPAPLLYMPSEYTTEPDGKVYYKGQFARMTRTGIQGDHVIIHSSASKLVVYGFFKTQYIRNVTVKTFSWELDAHMRLSEALETNEMILSMSMGMFDVTMPPSLHQKTGKHVAKRVK
jgi:hypothetical protein